MLCRNLFVIRIHCFVEQDDFFDKGLLAKTLFQICVSGTRLGKQCEVNGKSKGIHHKRRKKNESAFCKKQMKRFVFPEASPEEQSKRNYHCKRCPFDGIAYAKQESGGEQKKEFCFDG